jgi:hypothetical protein
MFVRVFFIIGFLVSILGIGCIFGGILAAIESYFLQAQEVKRSHDGAGLRLH